MKKIKSILLFFVLILLQNKVSAQTQQTATLSLQNVEKSNNSTEPTNTINKIVNPNQTLTTLTTNTVSSEAIPSPENQGFDKVIKNNKTVYMKKVDNVIIEYTPQ